MPDDVRDRIVEECATRNTIPCSSHERSVTKPRSAEAEQRQAAETVLDRRLRQTGASACSTSEREHPPGCLFASFE